MEDEGDRRFLEWYRYLPSRTRLTDICLKALTVGAKGRASSGRIRAYTVALQKGPL